jgi:hypothetical protein
VDSNAIIIVFVFFALVMLAAWILTAHFIAKAARMKNRSYASFFVLSLLISPITTGLIVATLPFNQDDPRHPKNKAAGFTTQPQYNSPSSNFDAFN